MSHTKNLSIDRDNELDVMIVDMINFYGFAVKHSEKLEPLARHLLREGWQKVQEGTP